MLNLWAAFAFLTAFAFADQAYLTQIHEVGARYEATSVDGVGKNIPAGQHSGTNCPLCQTIAASGAYLAPSTASLFVPVSDAGQTLLPPRAIKATGILPGHIWQGRAPPRL